MQEPILKKSSSDGHCEDAESAQRSQFEIHRLPTVKPPLPSSGSVPTLRTDAGLSRVEYFRLRVPGNNYDAAEIVTDQEFVDATNRECEGVLLELRKIHRPTLKRLFRELSPPPLNSLVGEYDAELLDQGGPIRNAVTRSMFRMHGSWIGKAFHPVGRSSGVGYNLFRSRGSIIRKLPMDTTISNSTLDDRLSLMIKYEANNQGMIRKLTGEVRQVTRNVLLGIGLFGGHGSRHCKIPFVLVGPRRAFTFNDKTHHLRQQANQS